MDFEKLKKQVKLRAYLFVQDLRLQLIRYRRTIEKPADWIEGKVRDYQIKKLEKELRRMEKEAEEEYGKGKGRSIYNCRRPSE